MELALPASAAEDAALSEQVLAVGADIVHVWVEIDRLGRPGSTNWYTEFGRRLDTEDIRFAPGEPNNSGFEECVEFVPSFGYNDLPCNWTIPYVCWG